MRKLFTFFASASLLAAAPAAAEPPAIVPGAPAASAQLRAVMLYELFEADGDASQCNNQAHGEIITAYDRWSRAIRIDTDNRSGGCRFNLAVLDPVGQLRNWRATMAFRATGDGGQCGNQGIQDVQVVGSIPDVDNRRAIRIDTDDRSGGCRLTFTVTGRGPSLIIYFVHDDEGREQCIRAADVQIVRPGQSREIVIDTDQRYGGCVLQFRLR